MTASARYFALAFSALYLLATVQGALANIDELIKPRPDKVALIFLPGIFGSRLYNTRTNEWHWGEDDYGSRGLSLIDFPSFKTSLLEAASIKVKGMKIGERDVYSDFKNHSQWITGSVLSFSYDWRKSNRETASYFNEWICDKISKEKDPPRLVIVAHSMGGLIIRHWLREFVESGQVCKYAEADRINQIIFAGTPHLGSLEPVESLVTGESALTKEPFFSLLFSDNVIRDALTFRSTYELLPAHNLVRPDCAVANTALAEKLTVIGDTATAVELQLWNIEHWKMLNLPKKLPKNTDRKQMYELIESRLEKASDAACELLTHSHPEHITKKFVFITGSKSDSENTSKLRDTLSSIEFSVNRQGHNETWKMDLGDSTVPAWSAYPETYLQPNNSRYVNAYHDKLLSNADAKLSIENVLKFAAKAAAIESNNILTIKPKNREQLTKLIEEVSDINLQSIDINIYNKAISQISKIAKNIGITGDEVYEIARNYDGVNRQKFRAVGFSVAAMDLDNLNEDRRFWSYQNAAYALYRMGAAELAFTSALEAGKVNIINFGSGNYAEQIQDPNKFFLHDPKWRSVAASSLETLGQPETSNAFRNQPIPSVPALLNIRPPELEVRF